MPSCTRHKRLFHAAVAASTTADLDEPVLDGVEPITVYSAEPAPDTAQPLLHWPSPIAKNSPFRSGPLKGLAEVEEIVFDWVSWYNNDRLHSFLGNASPV